MTHGELDADGWYHVKIKRKALVRVLHTQDEEFHYTRTYNENNELLKEVKTPLKDLRA